MADTMDLEYDAWRALCEILRTSGIVTGQDLKAPRSKEPETKGMQILSTIIAYGELKGRHALSSDKRDDFEVVIAETWKKLCKQLGDTGFFRRSDFHVRRASPTSVLNPGEQVVYDIRAWSDLRAKLHAETETVVRRREKAFDNFEKNASERMLAANRRAEALFTALTVQERATACNGLRVAAEHFDEDAKVARDAGHPGMAEQFERQAIDSRELAERME